ncbi:hypothetical protein T12_12601 [Trichinella patagoniensis]|uniref:Uncharacterized protein n=1 Tax=Trichinella patagoniensis TaxID=990121 RepID=A0A0V0ZNA7_9BILA|nr:hypothetical protein T12_12601 [Trichinella patagoniensis]
MRNTCQVDQTKHDLFISLCLKYYLVVTGHYKLSSSLKQSIILQFNPFNSSVYSFASAIVSSLQTECRNYFVYFLFCFWNPRFFRLFEYCTDFRDEEIESVPLNWTAKLAGCLATWNTGRCSDTDPRQSRGRIEIEWKVGRNKGRFL